MIAVIDRSELNVTKRDAELRKNLPEFIDAVATANPMLEFRANNNCVTSDREDVDGVRVSVDKLYRVRVFQDGEELGSLHATTRWRGQHGKEEVYGVESFRVAKSRGNRDTVYSKDFRVALRNAKKMLVPRANTELLHHVHYNVSNPLQNFAGQAQNQARYGMDMSAEMMGYIVQAYHAHLEGRTTVEMPVRIKTVMDIDEHYRRCDRMERFNDLLLMLQNNEGYGIQVLPDGQIVCLSYGVERTVRKYKDFESLPSNVSEKLAVFKVLDIGDPYSQFGVKLPDDFFFIAK